jgi:transcriptional regulator with XRE-family HTH domain
MNHASFNYVRTFRQRHAFNEGELAFLTNLRSSSAVSRIEIGGRVPSLEVALALQVVFDQSPRDLFPGSYEAAEESVMRRAHLLIEELEAAGDARSRAKRAFLEGLPRRGNDDGV